MNETQTIDPRFALAIASLFIVGAITSFVNGSVAGAVFGWVMGVIVSYRAWQVKKA